MCAAGIKYVISYHAIVVFDRIAIDPTNEVSIAAAVVATVAAILMTHPVSDRIGRDTLLWRRVRSLLPYVDEAARERGFYTSYSVTSDEVAGRVEAPLSAVESALRDAGYYLGPLAAHKSYQGVGEVGSWVKHGPIRPRSLPWPLSAAYLLVYPYQTHVTLFPHPTGDGYLLTAHREYSAYSPFVAYWHFKRRRYSPQSGIKRVSADLKNVESFVPSEKAANAVKFEELSTSGGLE